MALWSRVMIGLRALVQNRRVEQELDDEVQEYLETAVQGKMAAGMTREQAVRAARIDIGSLEAVKDRVRDVGWESRVETIWRDVRYALRMMRRSPGVSAVAVFTMAIGIAAATSMFGIMRNLLLAPPPHVAAPDRVFRLHKMFPPSGPQGEPYIGSRTSYPFFEVVARQATSLEAVAGYVDSKTPAGTGSDARLTRSVMVSAGFWKTLGARPALGRFIEDAEAHPATGSRVVVLGHAFWRGPFGGRADAIGRTLRIKGQPYEIVGVAPRGFRGIELADVDLWLPLFAREDGSGRSVTWHKSGSSSNLTLVARLKTQAAAEQASAELTTLYRAFLEQVYDPRETAERARIGEARTVLGPITGGLGEDLRTIPEARIAAWLVGVAFLLLTIACANVAGLLLLRAIRRRREIAMRLALGASRRRLALQLLTESSILALLGGCAALLTVVWTGAWLQRRLLPAMAWEPSTFFDPSVLATAGLCVIGAACAAGMAPLYYARADGVWALRDGGTRGPAKRPRMLSALIAVQGALSVVLLVGAGLFLRSVHNARTVDIGLDRDSVLTVQIDFSGTGRSAADVAAFFERALERASALPGAAQASLATSVPLRNARGGSSLRLPGRSDLPRLATGGPYVNAVTPGFFAAAGMRLREGREFVEQDRNRGGVIVVNEALAKLYWPDRSAIGECVHLRREAGCTTVVGVVADARGFRIVEEDRYLYYYRPLDYRPLAAGEREDRALLLRMAPGAKGVEGTVRRTMLELDPDLPFIDIRTLGEALDPQMRPWRLGASVFTAFGTLAVVLAMIGLWSSVAYAVSQRTQEFAIRMALGASRGSLVTLMLGDGLRNALTAVAGGLVLAGVASRYMTDLLYAVSPRDPLVFAAVAAGILTIATIASLLPAWRVSAIDPVAALRAD